MFRRNSGESTGSESENNRRTSAGTDTGTTGGTGGGAGEGTGESSRKGTRLEGVEVPDVYGKIVGFKMFKCETQRPDNPTEFNAYRARDIGGTEKIREHTLLSPIQHTEWYRGRDKATFVGEDEGGLYAFLEPNDSYMGRRIRYKGTLWEIPAIVRGWGEVYVYQSGFRAEYLEICCLAFNTEWRYMDVEAYRKWAMDRYECDICPEESLWETASNYGSPVPSEFIPKCRNYVW